MKRIATTASMPKISWSPFLFFVFMGLLSSPQIGADTSLSSCTTVDLRNDPRMPPIRAQGDSGLCYASVAADLISYAYLQGAQVSYLDLALKFSSASMMAELDTSKYGWLEDGGYIGGALEVAQKSGACLEKDISPEARLLAKEFLEQTKVANLSTEVNAELANVPGTPDYLIKAFQAIQAVEDNYQKNQSLIQANQFLSNVNVIFPNIDVHTLDQVLSTTLKTPDNFFVDLDKANCKDLVALPKGAKITSDSLVMGNTTMDSLFGEIDTQLNQHNIVGMDYFFHLRDLSQVGKATDGHDSIIAGRRFDASSQQCEYLIKDSHGTDCYQYDPKLRPKCDAGYIWVPYQVLQQDIEGIEYIPAP